MGRRDHSSNNEHDAGRHERFHDTDDHEWLDDLRPTWAEAEADRIALDEERS